MLLEVIQTDKWDNRGSTNMMLALWTAVTVSRLLSRAYANAYSATLIDASSVIFLMLCTTPSTICNANDDWLKEN